MAQSLHVMRTSNADWVVHRPCRDQVISRHGSEHSAISAARQELMSVGGGELVIHGDDGRVHTKQRVSSAAYPLKLPSLVAGGDASQIVGA